MRAGAGLGPTGPGMSILMRESGGLVQGLSVPPRGMHSNHARRGSGMLRGKGGQRLAKSTGDAARQSLFHPLFLI
jgi:hypothetical protein